ncbi:hypothetical protein DmAi_22890 [Acetobacter persici]|uniref:Uncharacterized protein n=1 Tax=Acetobacter persici TaxID=1076596 RepID=A0A6V8I9H3_9PROT|nr:hypothetical protein DmAi_22890 [Acetobacter persici]
MITIITGRALTGITIITAIMTMIVRRRRHAPCCADRQKPTHEGSGFCKNPLPFSGR